MSIHNECHQMSLSVTVFILCSHCFFLSLLMMCISLLFFAFIDTTKFNWFKLLFSCRLLCFFFPCHSGCLVLGSRNSASTDVRQRFGFDGSRQHIHTHHFHFRDLCTEKRLFPFHCHYYGTIKMKMKTLAHGCLYRHSSPTK